MHMVDTEGNHLFARGYVNRSATIAINESQSGEIDLESFALAGLVMPAAWTAAVLTLLVASASGGTFQPLYDDAGNEVTIQAAASRSIGLEVAAGALAPWRFVKLRSGTSGAAVNQEAARSLTLVLKG